MEIHKKIWPEYFDKVGSGEKSFEIRLADFGCSPGDILVLEEWDPKDKKYTGRKLRRKVTYITRFNPQKFWSQDDVERFGVYIISIRSE